MSPPRRPRHMPGDPVHKDKPQVPAVHPVNKPFITWTKPGGLRTTGVDLKTRLEKAEEDLKKAKQELKAREMQARARKQEPAKHKTAEEELRVKIETTKKDLKAKEESVAARRARNNAKHDEFLRGTYEKREVKHQEKARVQVDAHGAEMDGVELTITGAAEEDFDIEFDIDIYGDE
jgi:hypothetical protein